MKRKLRMVVALFWVTLYFSSGASKLARSATSKSVHQLTVKSVVFVPVAPEEAKDGYDTKISVSIAQSGLPPQLPGRKYARADISLPQVQVFSQTASSTFRIPRVNLKIHLLVSNPVVVSFLIKRSNLPKTKIILRAVLAHRYIYQITDKPTRYEFHNRVVVPFEITIREPSKTL